MLNCNIKLNDSSQINQIHTFGLHNSKPLNEPEKTGSRNHPKFPLLRSEQIGALNLQATPSELSAAKNQREHHIQPFPVRLGVYIHTLCPPDLSRLDLRPFRHRIVDHNYGSELQNARFRSFSPADSDRGCVFSGEIVVHVDYEVCLVRLGIEEVWEAIGEVESKDGEEEEVCEGEETGNCHGFC